MLLLENETVFDLSSVVASDKTLLGLLDLF